MTEEKANRDRFLGILKKKTDTKLLVVINGHGDDTAIGGHNNEILISSQEASLLRNKVVYARACNSINVLGKAAIDDGALAYIGYDVPFAFYTEDEKLLKPLEDKTAHLFLGPSNYVAISLIKGHSAGDANRRSRNKFRENIVRIMLDGPKSPYFYTLNTLYDDMIHQVCLGNERVIL